MNIDRRWWLTATLVIVLDQLSKWYVQKSSLNYAVTSDLKLTYAINYGAGFSILQHQRLLLILIPVLVVAGILYYFRKFPKNIHIPVALIFGGTVGNLIDRALFGYVRDFITIWIWPSFNLADTAITVGVIWIVGEELMMKKEK